MTKSRKQKLDDSYTVYEAAKTGQRPKVRAKDGSIQTHSVVPVNKGQSEAKVLVGCLDWLKARRVFCDRHDCGSGHGHAIYGIKHSGDIHGILSDGRHFEIEVKRGGGGRLSAGQQDRMARIHNLTVGLYFVVHGVEELEHYMGGLV